MGSASSSIASEQSSESGSKGAAPAASVPGRSRRRCCAYRCSSRATGVATSWLGAHGSAGSSRGCACAAMGWGPRCAEIAAAAISARDWRETGGSGTGACGGAGERGSDQGRSSSGQGGLGEPCKAWEGGLLMRRPGVCGASSAAIAHVPGRARRFCVGVARASSHIAGLACGREGAVARRRRPRIPHGSGTHLNCRVLAAQGTGAVGAPGAGGGGSRAARIRHARDRAGQRGS